MLDTNAVSAFMHGRSRTLDEAIAAHDRFDLCISAVSYGETLFGMAMRPEARRLAKAAHALFDNVDIVPWTSETAATYGQLRSAMRRAGIGLEPLDLMIAAHAVSLGATLVTSDTAFLHIPGLNVEDWTKA